MLFTQNLDTKGMYIFVCICHQSMFDFLLDIKKKALIFFRTHKIYNNVV
jgi:hypothetical protein